MYEEEDYDARGYGYELKPDVTVVKSCFLLKEAEEELIKKAKSESSEVTEVRLHGIVEIKSAAGIQTK